MIEMKTAKLLLLLTSLALLLTGTIKAESNTIYLLKLESSINPITKDYIVRGISKANQEGARALIIQLDTPGGLMESMKAIIEAIFASGVPVVVWVGPAGSRAGSAGVFITLAADVAVMATGTNIGAAHPVGLGGESPEEESPMAEKITSDAAAYARSIAEKRGRNVEWAQAAVRESASITSTEALKERVIDFIADNVDEELMEGLDGYVLGAREALVAAKDLLEENREALQEIAGDRLSAIDKSIAMFEETIAARDTEQAIEVASEIRDELKEIEGTVPEDRQDLGEALGEVRAGLERFIVSGGRTIVTSGATIQEIKMSLKDQLLNYLADPNVVYILLMLGLYGLIYEFFSPGIGFGLAAGGLSLLLAFMGLQILPINMVGLALILFGALLMVLDAFTPTNGILTTGGVISLLFGSFTLFNIESTVIKLSWWNIVTTVGIVTLLFIFIISKGLLIQRKRATTGLEGMIGAVGEAREDIVSEGTVFVKGEYWKALSSYDEEIRKGDEVLVEGVRGPKLLVRKRR